MNRLGAIAKFIADNESVSNNEIAEKLHLSMPTVLQYTRVLKERGVIAETGKYDSTGGRKATAFSVNGGIAYAVGVEVKNRSLFFALVDMSCKLLATAQYEEEFADVPGYFRKIGQKTAEFLDRNEIPASKVAGVGLAVPGIVDREKKVLLRSHALGVRQMSFSELERCLNFPFQVENDANCAAFAQLRGTKKDAVYLSLNDTVGGAIFLNGNLYRGDGFKSGEFGHMILEPGGKVCYCGKNGCMDAYCSAKILKSAGGGSLNSFFEALNRSDAQAQVVWQNYMHYLSLAAANLRMAFDCTLVLGGEVGGYLKEYLLPLSEEVKKFNNFDFGTDYLKVGNYKSEAPAFGATLCFVDRFFEKLI